MDERTWRCRADLLPLASVIAVDAKSYTSERWVPISATRSDCVPFDHDYNSRGFVINGHAYCARPVKRPDGAVGYTDLMRGEVQRWSAPL